MTDGFLGAVADNVNLRSHELRIGYLYQYGPFYVEPTLGIASWSIDLEEGEFMNPGLTNYVNNKIQTV